MWKICNLLKTCRSQGILICNRQINSAEDERRRWPGEGTKSHENGTSSSERRESRSADDDDGEEDFFRCDQTEYDYCRRQNVKFFLETFGLTAAVTTGLNLILCPHASRRETSRRQGEGVISRLYALPGGLFYSPTTTFNVVPKAITNGFTGSSKQFTEIAVQTDSKVSDDEDIGEASRSLIGSFENSLGLDLLQNGLRTEAFQHFSKSSQLSNAKGAFNLGLCYYKGYGTRSNWDKAIVEWQKAARLGNSAAKYQLGIGHLRGFGSLPVDETLAMSYIFEAADDNVPEAQNYAGAYYFKLGQFEKSKNFFEAAASAGNKTADGVLTKVFKTKNPKNSTESRQNSKTVTKFWTGNDDDRVSSDDDETRFRNENFHSNDEFSSDSCVIFEDSSENYSRKPQSNVINQFVARLLSKPGCNPVKKSNSVHDFRVKS